MEIGKILSEKLRENSENLMKVLNMSDSLRRKKNKDKKSVEYLEYSTFKKKVEQEHKALNKEVKEQQKLK